VALIAQDGVDLTPTESTELSHRAFAPRGNRADAKRALAIMLLAAGDSYTDIQKAIGCSSQFVARWKARFLAERLAGLDPVEPGGRRGKRKQAIVTPQQESRVLAKSRETPPDGADQWTPESLGRALRTDAKCVAQIWQAAGIDPKRVENFRDATDPSFEEKAADLIGLYVQGGQRVAVFALGDAPATKAAKAAGPSGNGRNGNGNGHAANGNGHAIAGGDFSSSGSLSLYAMLNSPRGLTRKASPVSASASSASRDTKRANGPTGSSANANVAGFIDDVLKKGSSKRPIHIFVEGLDDKRAADLRTAIRRRAGVQLHEADSYATWLNQVDIWLAKIDRDFVAGKVLTRHAELRHKVMQSLRATEKRAQGFRWSVGEN
jgi:transposase